MENSTSSLIQRTHTARRTVVNRALTKKSTKTPTAQALENATQERRFGGRQAPERTA